MRVRSRGDGSDLRSARCRCQWPRGSGVTAVVIDRSAPSPAVERTRRQRHIGALPADRGSTTTTTTARRVRRLTDHDNGSGSTAAGARWSVVQPEAWMPVRLRAREARHSTRKSALSLRSNAGPCQEICLDDGTVIHAPQPKGIAESSGGRRSRPQPRWGWGRWVGRPTQGSGANAATLGFIPLPRWGIGDRAYDGPRAGSFTRGRV
jgi:hypothetical protein